MMKARLNALLLAPTIAAGLILGTSMQSSQTPGLVDGMQVQLVAAHNVVVTCQLVRFKDGVAEAVGYLEGYGTSSIYSNARRMALQDVDRQVPQGHYKRHCRDGPIKRGGGGRF